VLPSKTRLTLLKKGGERYNMLIVVENKDFKGELCDIEPNLLLGKNKQDRYQDFFLILGMIYNDLKGQIFVLKQLEDHYRKPSSTEKSAHAGEYGGIMTQVNKYLISIVGEFSLFLDHYTDVVGDMRFQLLLKELRKTNQKVWNGWNNLFYYRRDETSLLSKIAQIRSNVSFHFDHNASGLRRGFIRSFFDEGKSLAQHDKAYFSLGDSMESIRIYYSDAAVQEYINSLLNTTDMESIRTSIHDMNNTICILLTLYLRRIKKSKR
jgi:hypothetical protein